MTNNNTSENHPYSSYSYFFEKEKALGLFELQYQGIPMWQLVRVWALKQITKSGQSSISQKESFSYIKLYYNTVKAAIRQRRLLPKMEHTDLMIIRPCSRHPIQRAYKDREFDYSDLPVFFSVTDLFAQGLYLDENYYDSFDFSIPELNVIIWKAKRKVFQFGIKTEYQVLREFLEDINSFYHTALSYDDLIREIQYSCKSFDVYYQYTKRILDRIKPGLVLLSTHYDEHCFAVIAAARDSGIKTGEVQHGRINDHEAYYYEDSSNTGKILPDYLFTYGDWWNSQIRMPASVKVISVGYPYLEALKIPKKRDDNRIIISAFSGPQTGIILSKFLIDCNDILQRHGAIVLYKIHPAEALVWEREYPWLKENDNFRIYADPSTSVYDLLNQSDIAIAVNSTVLYEAAAYSELTIAILNKENIRPMIPLIKNNIAITVSDKKEFERLLVHPKTIHKDSTAIRQSFFKENAKNNTVKAFRAILDEV